MPRKSAGATKKAPAKKKAAAQAPTLSGSVQGNERDIALADLNAHALSQQEMDRQGLMVVQEEVWYDRPSPGAPDVPMTILAFHAGQIVNQAQLDFAEEQWGVKKVKTRKAVFGDN